MLAGLLPNSSGQLTCSWPRS